MSRTIISCELVDPTPTEVSDERRSVLTNRIARASDYRELPGIIEALADDELVTLSEDITNLYVHEIGWLGLDARVNNGVVTINLGEKANMITWFACVVDSMRCEMARRRLHNCFTTLVMVN
jgi:hypothetical protein